MNFSELFKLSGLLGRFSPDGKCLVSVGRRQRGRAARDGAVGRAPERPRRGAPRAWPGWAGLRADTERAAMEPRSPRA